MHRYVSMHVPFKAALLLRIIRQLERSKPLGLSCEALRELIKPFQLSVTALRLSARYDAMHLDVV